MALGTDPDPTTSTNMHDAVWNFGGKRKKEDGGIGGYTHLYYSADGEGTNRSGPPHARSKKVNDAPVLALLLLYVFTSGTAGKIRPHHVQFVTGARRARGYGKGGGYDQGGVEGWDGVSTSCLEGGGGGDRAR